MIMDWHVMCMYTPTTKENTMTNHLLIAKYDRHYEIECYGCGETWTASCEGFVEAAKSLEESNDCECTACNDDLADKYIN